MNISYRQRMSLLVLTDLLVVTVSCFIGNFYFFSNELTIFLVSSLGLLLFHYMYSHFFGLYRKAWEYASVGEVVHIFKAVSLSIACTMLVQFAIFSTINLHIYYFTWLMNMIFIGGSRFMWRLYRERIITESKTNKKRTLIIGAGSAGAMITRQLLQDEDCDLLPVSFLDDNLQKQRLEIFNVPVVGTMKQIQRVVKECDIEHIVIAIPSLLPKDVNRIFRACQQTKIKTQIIPRVEAIAEGKVSLSQLRDVSVEDLLGRKTVHLDDHGIKGFLKGKVVLITGAGGSIGSEICRQVMRYEPKKLVILGHGENSIYNIEMELLEKYHNSKTEIVAEIKDIQDRNAIFEVVEKHVPYIIYHAAAHKHVPLMERNPGEAIKNNVFGTRNVAEAADTFGVNTFVMISTDKAVNPTNVMGATKRIAEMLIQGLDRMSQTRFVAVRFGNVLGSRGSVIPLFKKQIAKGGPVTVTHKEMTRFFMTIPEASRLVIQAGSFAKGGEIFVLDMGEPVKIIDLACNLITLSGYTEAEIPIEFSGLRPGEKMYEELLMDDENLGKTPHEKIFIGQPIAEQYTILNEKLSDIEKYLYDDIALRQKLFSIVPTYQVAEHDRPKFVRSQ